jgi:hypothetical protein
MKENYYHFHIMKINKFDDGYHHHIIIIIIKSINKSNKIVSQLTSSLYLVPAPMDSKSFTFATSPRLAALNSSSSLEVVII